MILYEWVLFWFFLTFIIAGIMALVDKLDGRAKKPNYARWKKRSRVYNIWDRDI